jgi:hypothetical protein
MKEENEIWFPAKKHGFGWGLPVSWKGWVVLAIYALLLVIGAIFLTKPGIPVAFFITHIVVFSGGIDFHLLEERRKDLKLQFSIAVI